MEIHDRFISIIKIHDLIQKVQKTNKTSHDANLEICTDHSATAASEKWRILYNYKFNSKMQLQYNTKCFNLQKRSTSTIDTRETVPREWNAHVDEDLRAPN
jgi:hypothetical protein